VYSRSNQGTYDTQTDAVPESMVYGRPLFYPLKYSLHLPHHPCNDLSCPEAIDIADPITIT
jgi:hypothetical protein